MNEARLLDLGVRPYREVWDMQHELHARVRDGLDPQTWILVEHSPVITLGRNAKRANLLRSQEELGRRGVDVIEIERGGDVTYHGPGQLVVYVIRRLERFREVVPLVRALEGAVIDACASFGLHGERWSDHAGVWMGRNQICAIGLAVRGMTSMHGVALNANTDLSYEGLINPCGLTDRGVTSLSREAGRTVTVAHAKIPLLTALSEHFDIRFASLKKAS